MSRAGAGGGTRPGRSGSFLTGLMIAGLFMIAPELCTAAPLELLLMPGPLTRSHAELEDNCDNCHVHNGRGAPATFCWFVEEVGELATAINGSDDENLAEEIADVIAWLTTLANIRGVDLESALRKKYLQGAGPAGTK